MASFWLVAMVDGADDLQCSAMYALGGIHIMSMDNLAASVSFVHDDAWT